MMKGKRQRIVKNERKKMKGTLGTTRHLQLQLSQFSLSSLHKSSTPTSSTFQNLLDTQAAPNPPAPSSNDVAVDAKNSSVDHTDFILSQDFFCTPDYITPDNQCILNGMDFNKDNTPCPKSPEKQNFKAMQKVFNSLLQEFCELGATIVFADFSKIIIGTEEYDLSAAKVRCNSLLQTIKSRDRFEWIEFEPLQFWNSLLFVDQYNYCGQPENSVEAKNDKSENSVETGTKSLWNLLNTCRKSSKIILLVMFPNMLIGIINVCLKIYQSWTSKLQRYLN